MKIYRVKKLLENCSTGTGNFYATVYENWNTFMLDI